MITINLSIDCNISCIDLDHLFISAKNVNNE